MYILYINGVWMLFLNKERQPFNNWTKKKRNSQGVIFVETFNFVFSLIIFGLSVFFFRLSFLYTSEKHAKVKREMISLKKSQGINGDEMTSNLSFYVRLPYWVTKAFILVTAIILISISLFIMKNILTY